MKTTLEEVKQGNILKIKRGNSIYRVDLTSELRISEDTINSQLKNAPSSYAYLCTLRDKAIYERDRAEKEKDRAFSKSYLYYRDIPGMNNEKATHMANLNANYISKSDIHMKLSLKASQLISACRAYEERGRILQTLSANIRKEK